MDSDSYTVFVAGVHGVGKGSICSTVAPILGAHHVTASSLIKRAKTLGASKAISDIDENQRALIEQHKLLNETEKRILLDGHFCLLNQEWVVERLPVSLFADLKLSKILLATCDAKVVHQRLSSRDGHPHNLSISDIDQFQQQEIEHAHKVASELNVSIAVVDTMDEAVAVSVAIRYLS